jgi:hypothetical protein
MALIRAVTVDGEIGSAARNRGRLDGCLFDNTAASWIGVAGFVVVYVLPVVIVAI